MIAHRKLEASKILYEKYLEFRGRNPYDICSEFSIKIIHYSHVGKRNGYLNKISCENKNIYSIQLSSEKISNEYEQLIIWHELAHYLLDDLSLRVWHTPTDPTLEAFCDNFSLAMILAQHNYKPTDIQDYENFFQTGIGLEPLTESDPYLGRKILLYLSNPNQLNLPFEQEPIVNIPEGRAHPLVDLAHLLIKNESL